MSLSLRFAAGSHKGMIREGNEDSGYAGPRLLAVADGMGGAAAGEVASSEVLSTMVELDEDLPGTDLREVLRLAVDRANDRLRVMIEDDPGLEGMGTTLTALLWTGSGLGMVHVGDSRAYLLRDGALEQITQDHTWVQRLVDEGRITEEEAGHHPQRSLLMRALDGRGQVEPDLTLREARLGDRYLICSDGLSGVVSRETMQDTLLAYADPREAVQELIQLALRGGGPDNITCIVADLVDSDQTPSDIPMVVGAVAEDLGDTTTLPTTPASRARELTQGEYEAEALLPETPQSRRKPKSAWRRTLPVWGPAVLVLAALGGAYWWTQTQYYVAADGNNVTVYKGIDTKIFGISLSSPYQTYHDIDITQFSAPYQQSLKDHYEATGLSDARKYMDKVRDQAGLCTSIKEWNQTHPVTVPSQVPPSQNPGQTTPPVNGATPGGESVSPTTTATATGQAAPIRTGAPTATATSRSTSRPGGNAKQNAAGTAAPGESGAPTAPPSSAPPTTAPPAAPQKFDAGEQADKVSNCAVQPNGSS